MSGPGRLGLGFGTNDRTHETVGSEMNRSNSSNNDLAAGAKRSPFIGIFWDIENCPIPDSKSVKDVVSFLREKFVLSPGRREREFVVVCDTRKERTVDDLNEQQVNVVHVQCRSKNMADNKLQACMRKFYDTHSPGDCCMLISGDINFQETLMTGKLDKQFHIIVLHPGRANDNFLHFAHECYSYEDLISQVPDAGKRVAPNHEYNNTLYVANLPPTWDREKLEKVIRSKIDMVGGRVKFVDKAKRLALVCFANPSQTRRGYAKMRHEEIGGYITQCSFHSKSELERERQESEGIKPASSRHHHHSGNSWQNGYSPPNGSNHLAESMSQMHVTNQAPTQAQRGVFASHKRDDSLSYSAALAAPSSGMSNGVSRFAQGLEPEVPEAPTSSQPFGLKKSKTPGFFERYWDKETLKNVSLQNAGNRSEDEDAPRVSLLKRGSPSSPGLNVGASTSNAADAGDVSSGSAAESETKSRQNSGGDEEEHRDLVDVYIVNLDNSVIDEPELYPVLLGMVDDITDSDNDTLTIRQAPNNVTYAHLAVTPEDAVKLKAELDDVNFHGRVLKVTDESPEVRPNSSSSPVSEQMIPQEDPTQKGRKAKDNSGGLNALRRAVIRIFKLAKKDELPFITLLRSFEKEYDQPLDLKTLRAMSDIVREQERDTTKFMQLNPEAKRWDDDMEKKKAVEMLALAYCNKHCPGGFTNGVWAKKLYDPLKLYHVSGVEFADTVSQLLKKHQNSLPLNSFLVCYDEFYKDKLKEVAQNDSTNRRAGVFLEHLLLSVPNVSIAKRPNGPRQLVLAGSNEKIKQDKNVAGSSNGAGVSFGADVQKMLESQPRAAMHYLNLADALRQCGILCDTRGDDSETLLASLQQSSADIEVIGFGAERVVTLGHAAQVRRFLVFVEQIRVLCEDEITAANIGMLFEMAGLKSSKDKVFDVADFGMCEVKELLAHITDAPQPAVVADQNAGTSTARTNDPEEPVYSLFRFAEESKNLLTKQPGYSEDFIRFPQKFRKLYGRELKNRSYGYEKLSDLCEAVGEILEVVPVPGTKDRRVVLKMDERYKHLRGVVDQIFKDKNEMSQAAFKEEFKHVGWEFKPEHYGCEELDEVLFNLGDDIKVEKSRRKLMLVKRSANDSMEGHGSVTEMDSGSSASASPRNRNMPIRAMDTQEEVNLQSLQPSFSSTRLAVNFGQ